jgi:molybdenum cofactor biosynthesis protein B
MSESAREHQQAAEAMTAREPVPVAVLTVSDTRTMQTDRGGPRIAEILTCAGHRIGDRQIVPDDTESIRSVLQRWISDPTIHAIITTGGTGISRRDQTVDVVRSLVTLELPGFGELMRMISWQEIGSPAMLSRAMAGIVTTSPGEYQDTLIFSLPGSVNAIEIAMNRLVVPELAHLVWERRKH